MSYCSKQPGDEVLWLGDELSPEATTSLPTTDLSILKRLDLDHLDTCLLTFLSKMKYQDNDPHPTHVDLPRARKLLQRRRTRAGKLVVRKEALRLFVNALPGQVFHQIFKKFLTPPFHTVEGTKSLEACSLVCRRWSGLAQSCLHEDATIPDSDSLSKFHRTLTSPGRLGECVRRFLVSTSAFPEDAIPIPVTQMIADCLEHTTNLEVLHLDIQPPASLTDAIMERLRLLPRLKVFRLNLRNHPLRPVNTISFDPMMLCSLPMTVEKLSLARPFLDLARVLPDILQGVYPSLRDASAQSKGGLKHLEFVTNVPGTSNAIDFPALINTTSLPDTLTALSLKLMSRIFNNELKLWTNFMGVCKRLEEIDMGLPLVAPSILSTMPALRQLRFLKIHVLCRPTQAEWDKFSDSIVGYVAQTPRLTDFSLKAHQEDCTGVSVEHFIRDLLAAFCTGKRCRLRSFSFGVFGNPTLDEIETVGVENVLRSSRCVGPPIRAFELLCTRATQLEHLEVAVPLDFLPRVTTALQRLKHLKSALLHNYPLTIDPVVPLRKMKQYKHFLHCCKLLKNFMSLVGPEWLAEQWEQGDWEQEQEELGEFEDLEEQEEHGLQAEQADQTD